MCANYEPISKDRVHLLDLLEPTFDYKKLMFIRVTTALLYFLRMATLNGGK